MRTPCFNLHVSSDEGKQSERIIWCLVDVTQNKSTSFAADQRNSRSSKAVLSFPPDLLLVFLTSNYLPWHLLNRTIWALYSCPTWDDSCCSLDTCSILWSPTPTSSIYLFSNVLKIA